MAVLERQETLSEVEEAVKAEQTAEETIAEIRRLEESALSGGDLQAIEARALELVESLESYAYQLGYEERGWVRLGDGSSGNWYPFEPLERILEEAYMFWLRNPLGGAACRILTDFAIGDGIKYDSENAKVKDAMDDFMLAPENEAEIGSVLGQQQKNYDLFVYGNLFLLLFDRPDGSVTIRSLPAAEIKDIIREPDDFQAPQRYMRVYNAVTKTIDGNAVHTHGESRTRFYWDWRHPDRPDGEPGIYHVKVNCLTHMPFGVSMLYRSFDWLKLYKKYLLDWAARASALARFAWRMQVQGGSSAIAAAKAKFASTIGTGMETNPPPAAGSYWLQNAGVNLDPFRTAGAYAAATEARPLKGMVCAALGMPEHYMGDTGNSNLATAEAVQLPMVRSFESWQGICKDVYRNIFVYVVDRKASVERWDSYKDGKIDGVPIKKLVNVDYRQIVTSQIPQLMQGLAGLADHMPEEVVQTTVAGWLSIDNFKPKLVKKTRDREGVQNFTRMVRDAEPKPL